mmetsp:Transcript_20618/g.71310  ORF Transcript_20618/g.71310 Transcript_20618/m.71310 type:complete len:229 (+) Transcript_20618:1613-2299(+)
MVFVGVRFAGLRLRQEAVELCELVRAHHEAEGGVRDGLHLCQGCGVELGFAAQRALGRLQRLDGALASRDGAHHVRLRGQKDLVLAIALGLGLLHVLVQGVDFLAELGDLAIQGGDLGAQQLDLLGELGDLSRGLLDGIQLLVHLLLAETSVLVVGRCLCLALLFHLHLKLLEEADDLLHRRDLGGLRGDRQRQHQQKCHRTAGHRHERRRSPCFIDAGCRAAWARQH